MEHLSLYIVLTTICNFGLEKYVATIRALNIDNTDPIMRGFSADGKLLSDQFCSVYSLEGNEAKRTVSDLFMRHCFAAVMVSFLTLMGLKIPDDQLGVVGGSVVHIICVVASNAHGITQTPKRKTWNISSENIEFMPVASLLMPVLSLLNHSCDPNVVRHNYNGTVVLRAIQPIPKNSQVIYIFIIKQNTNGQTSFFDVKLLLACLGGKTNDSYAMTAYFHGVAPPLSTPLCVTHILYVL